MAPRFAALVMLPHSQAASHLHSLARKLRLQGAGDLAAEVEAEALVLAGREARAARHVRRVRVADHFVLVTHDARRFVARRRQDQGEGWALVGPDGLFLGNHRTLDDCEKALPE